MLIRELFAQEQPVDEAKPSRKYCNTTPKKDMSASWKASCKSQGHLARSGGKSHKVGHERVKVRGKKILGKAYGGPLPDWS